MTPCIECKKAKINRDSFTSCIPSFLSYFIKSSWNLTLCIPKWFNTSQVLKMFSFLLWVTCMYVISALATKTDDWQAIIAVIVACDLIKTSKQL